MIAVVVIWADSRFGASAVVRVGSGDGEDASEDDKAMVGTTAKMAMAGGREHLRRHRAASNRGRKVSAV